MRFPLAAVMLVVASFIFFILFAVSSLLMTEVGDALDNVDDGMPSEYTNLRNLIPTAFGIICAIFFVSGILLIFFLESTSDEYEFYPTRRYR